MPPTGKSGARFLKCEVGSMFPDVQRPDSSRLEREDEWASEGIWERDGSLEPPNWDDVSRPDHGSDVARVSTRRALPSYLPLHSTGKAARRSPPCPPKPWRRRERADRRSGNRLRDRCGRPSGPSLAKPQKVGRDRRRVRRNLGEGGSVPIGGVATG